MSRHLERAAGRRTASSTSARRAPVVFDVADARPTGGLVGGRRLWFIENPSTYGSDPYNCGVWLPFDAYDAGDLDGMIEGAEVVTVKTSADLVALFPWFDPFGEKANARYSSS